MSSRGWKPLHGVDQRQLHEARLQSHYAVQWLARAARAYIPPQPDDGHTSLLWDADLDGFMTQPLSGGTRLNLQVSNLTLRVSGGDKNRVMSLDGRSNSQVRQWLGEQLGACGLDASALDAPSPYEMPAHDLARAAVYDAGGLADALTELAAWYGNASSSLDHVHRHLTRSNLATSAVCCWPHHFDLATLTMLPKHNADTGYVGVGLSPGDEYYDEPYFYVSVYPRPDPAMLPTLPMIGHWHTHEFAAAIVPAHKILAEKNRQAETDEFLIHSVDVVLRLLS